MSEHPSKPSKHYSTHHMVLCLASPDMLSYLPLTKTHAGERTWLNFASISYPNGPAQSSSKEALFWDNDVLIS